MTVQALASYPGKGRLHPTLCKIDDCHVFLMAGWDGDFLKSCLRFSYHTNAWEQMPDLLVARQGSASCQLGGNLYIFCGSNKVDGPLRSVERIKITEDPID